MLNTKRLRRDYIFRNSISQHLYCPICIDILDSPLRAKCGHTFCCLCIEQWIRLNNRSCPVCKQKIKSGSALERDLIPEKIVYDLQVRCVSQGCHWSGKNGLLRAHYVQCQFRDREVKSNSYVNFDVIQIEQQQHNQTRMTIDIDQ